MRSSLHYAVAGIALVALAHGQQFDASVYDRNATIHDDVDIYWTVDTATETFRVAVKAKVASGWAGFGFSEMGGMEGSDIVYYETLVRSCSGHIVGK